ncbi:MAG TPA: PaaX family transcriptional regulator C-terminal domain-containing protein [Chloroflexia bacterium]|nr:PaaX family transcriptional regulator C-terminal domain-containing protein [Chloroflexia bacterium]
MHPRSMLFTLWGVFIRHFGSEIALTALVRLMSEFGFSDAAVRAAISRLATQGWVSLRKAGRNSYLSMSPRGLQRVDEAANRIYRLQPERWDNQWLLLTYTIPEEQRNTRDQLRAELEWWGFGTLGTSTWISSHELSPALAARLNSPEIEPYISYFRASYCGPASNRELVQKSWNLQEVNLRYRQFLNRFKPGYQHAPAVELTDRECFVTRCWLVHEYRKFLFVDPGLPEELLGEDWLGSEAFALFYAYDQLLAAGAGRYFYDIFSNEPGATLGPEQVAHGLQAQLNPFARD